MRHNDRIFKIENADSDSAMKTKQTLFFSFKKGFILSVVGTLREVPFARYPFQCFRFVFSEACSHCRSYEYFAESVDSTMFVARKCDSYKHYTQGKCDDNESVIMGEHIDTNVTGVFYLKTHSKTPFAMG